MTVQRISPDGLLHPVPYAHVTVATGTRQVRIAGQTARDADGGTVEDRDLATQISDALRKVGTALAGVGGSFADVTHLTFYLPGWDASKIDAFLKGTSDVVEELGIPDPWPPYTVIGILSLWEADLLVEIQADATLD